MKRSFGIIDSEDNENSNDDPNDTPPEKKKPSLGLIGTTNVEIQGNHIYFYSTVNSNSVYKLNKIIQDECRKLEDLKAKNPLIKNLVYNPLYLFIQSYGGSLLPAFSAIDTIMNSTIPIYTVVDGYAASAGTLISIVGRKRFIKPNAYMLIHQITSSTSGKMNEIIDDFENCNLHMQHIKKIYIDNTRISPDEIDNILLHDKWWPAQKCIDYGLVDKYYQN
jgi:ATP-dependent protease ClpP protease subunit